MTSHSQVAAAIGVWIGATAWLTSTHRGDPRGGDDWLTEPRRNAAKPGQSRSPLPPTEGRDLQGQTGPRRLIYNCLPCRRSWVRVPSAASLDSLVWPSSAMAQRVSTGR